MQIDQTRAEGYFAYIRFLIEIYVIKQKYLLMTYNLF